MSEGRWRIEGRLEAQDVLKYCENDGVILHNGLKYVSPVHLEAFPPSEWKSLQLVRIGDITFERNPRDQRRWRAKFKDGLGSNLDLGLTDPVACRRLEQGEAIGKECLLTISLAGPWQPDNESLPRRCYKLVAGVVEL
ncbi:hypothetical protein LCGC14_0205220 [marine sediment metagenome]|uniref:Dual OB-containing domain-containing protein n=1 Tax=marine sediment metagenome TaxID=412755 RepID=A0A0F9UMB5_9ZZZZ